MADVTLITDEGFWLRTHKQEYFLSFDVYPWFRYVEDWQIKDVVLSAVGVGEHGDWLQWRSLDIDIGTEDIKRNDEALKCGETVQQCGSLCQPYSSGKIVDRKRASDGNKKEYLVFTGFYFSGSFEVTADSPEEARRIVEQQCELKCGGVEFRVLAAPIDSIEWDFTQEPVMKINEVVAVDDFIKDDDDEHVKSN